MLDDLALGSTASLATLEQGRVVVSMHMKIRVLDREVAYTLKRSSRSRRLRFAVHPGGRFMVSAPALMPQAMIDHHITDKARWVIDKIDRLKDFKGYTLRRGSKKEYIDHKDAALKLALARLEFFNREYGYTYNRVTIRNQKTRWGSCSRKGNLNFSYQIALLPPHLRDYIIVHELCHLREFNHSKKFWSLVARAVPSYQACRRELRLGSAT